jgi:hypothetical protein
LATMKPPLSSSLYIFSFLHIFLGKSRVGDDSGSL